MSKIEKRKTKNSYEQRRRRMISIVCIILAGLFLLWTVAGTMLFSFGEEREETNRSSAVKAQSAGSSTELRGIWVSTVGNLDYPTKPSVSPEALKAEADIVIRDCYDMGMNAIFLQVRPAADAFYPSAYYPWSRYLTGTQGTAPEDGFDPLAYWVERAHERGIELHAWINPYRITTSSSDWDRLSSNNPAKGAWNDYVVKFNGNYYFDPGQPAVRDLITAGVKEIVENYDVDGIHFDDYFYPDETSGNSFNDAGTYAAYGNGMSRADWRRDNINQQIRQVNDTVHAVDPHCVFGVSPMGIWANSWTSSLGSNTRGGESYSQRFADTYTWVKNQWIDYIAPQIYWKIGFSKADYKVLAEWWSQVVQGTNVSLYIGMADCWAIDGTWGSSGTADLIKQLKLNDTLPEISGEIHFRYKSAAGSTELFNLYKNIYASNRVPALTDPAGEESTEGLYDIAGHWAEPFILSLVRDGVITGMGDGTFRPEASVTRAQFVKMMALISGDTDFDGLPVTVFEDVDPGAWFAEPIKWAAAKGIVFGRSITEFAPDETITREEMAVMIYRYYIASSADTVDSQEQERSPSSGLFCDEDEISGWAVDAVRAVTGFGIMNGVSEDNDIYFYPSRNTTRAEAAKVICGLAGMTGSGINVEEETQE